MLKKIRKRVKKTLLSKWTTNLILPVLATLPSIALAEAKSLEPFPQWFFGWFNLFVAKHPWPRLFLLGWPAVLIVISFGLAKFRDWAKTQEHLGEEELALLFRALDVPVGKKLKRFGRAAKELFTTQGKVDAGAIFQQITQPEEQIALLVEGIYMVFLDEIAREDGQRHNDLKVTLAKMERGKIVGFECFLPHGAGPTSQPPDLRGRESAFSRAAEAKQILIIEDISKELQRKGKKLCVKGGDGASNAGSMICFPVVDQELDDVPFVISIKFTDKNHFKSGQSKRYSYILQRFAERIAMENRLRLIKEATQP